MGSNEPKTKDGRKATREMKGTHEKNANLTNGFPNDVIINPNSLGCPIRIFITLPHLPFYYNRAAFEHTNYHATWHMPILLSQMFLCSLSEELFKLQSNFYFLCEDLPIAFNALETQLFVLYGLSEQYAYFPDTNLIKFHLLVYVTVFPIRL